MKKLKSNRGITLPFTVVIMFFVALLMAALVGYASLSYQISTRQIRLAEHKIILENVMYKYISDLTGYNSDDELNGYEVKNKLENESNYDKRNELEIDYYYLKKYWKIIMEYDEHQENKLIIELKDESNYINIVLKAELEYSYSGTEIIYKITKWGF